MDRTANLGERWTRARRAALDTVASAPSPVAVDHDEDERLQRALATDEAAAQRRVFDNSLRLGESFRRFHATEFTLAELPAALDQLSATGAPCLRGVWSHVPDEDAVRLERAGCPLGAGGPQACDWWREAITGLVLGVTGGLRHTRHQSRGHGDARCVDVVHVDPESPLRFGPIPAEIRAGLDELARTVAIVDSSARIVFLGLSEGVLYYQLATAGCGGGDVRSQPLIERGVHRRFPQLSLCEVTPRPVLADP